MKKAVLVLLVVILGIALYFGFRKGGSTSVNTHDIAGIEAPPPGSKAFYTVTIKATQKSNSSETVLIDLDGTLSQLKQNDHEYLSEWQDISRLILMGSPVDAKSSAVFLRQPMVSSLEGDSYTHYLGNDFPPSLMTFQLSFLQKIFVGLKPGEPAVISAKEKDEVGLANVQYEFSKEGANVKVIKTWLLYAEDYIKVDAVDNHLTYGIAPDGRLLSVEGRLTLHYRQPTETHYTTNISVVLRDHKKVDTAKPIAKETLRKTDVASAASAGRAAVDQNEMTYEQAMQKLDAITEQTDSKDVYAVFSALKADVITNPDHSTALVNKILEIKERDPSSRRKLSTMFGALAQSQSPAIANQLADLATQCPDNYCKVQAIVGLNDHPFPNETNADKMLEIARGTSDAEISGTALLAAGSIGKKISDTLPELPKALIAELSDPAKVEMKSTVLAAMGNHGVADYYPSLEANLQSKDANVRSAAAYSMRYLPNPEATNTLIGVVQKESDDDVKREAIKALQYRNLSGEQYVSVAETSATLENKDVQQNAARLLVEAFHDNPKIAEAALRTLQDQTKFKDVKDYIESELNPPVAAPNAAP